MKRIVTVLALLTAFAPSALAGGDWDDDYYEYEDRRWRGDYRAYSYYGVPTYRVPSYGYYIPYGTYYADEPYDYGPNCKIERKWRHGRYKEKIECDDDD
jgi:hypothetical protein